MEKENNENPSKLVKYSIFAGLGVISIVAFPIYYVWWKSKNYDIREIKTSEKESSDD